MNPLENKGMTFECTRLKHSTKEGVLRADSDGCYTQLIGAINAHNHHGEFYSIKGAEKFFDRSTDSSFQRRIKRGVLRAEWGHPKMTPGMSQQNWHSRILTIDEDKVCATFREIWLGKQTIKDDKGRDVVPIYGKFIPSGPYGEALKKQLETPGENVCFSVRSITNNTLMTDGKVIKEFTNIITFDYVNEPGMYVAEKLLSPTLESLDETPIDIKTLENIANSSNNKYSVESKSVINLAKEIITSAKAIKVIKNKKLINW